MRVKEMIGRMNEAEDNLSNDPEALHSALDDILLECVAPDIKERYLEIQQNARWWASS